MDGLYSPGPKMAASTSHERALYPWLRWEVGVTMDQSRVWHNGNYAIADDISAPIPEVGDADVGRGPQLDDHVVRAEECGTSHWDQSVFAMCKISWKVRLLCWNHKLCYMDLDSEHLTPATFFWCVDFLDNALNFIICTFQWIMVELHNKRGWSGRGT